MTGRSTQSAAAAARRPAMWMIAVLALAALAAYHNSFVVPFVFDDHDAIDANPSIHSLVTGLFPPKADGMTVSGRPLVNLALAINYAISGRDVWSYHVVNLLIHIAAGLVLFGLVRRTLAFGAAGKRAGNAGGDIDSISFCVAFVWLLHPLQTESVTYVVQRAESLVSLFYLLTLYCFARSAAGEDGRKWQTLAVVACLAGMASKEVMVSAPLIVFLYDRTFVAGTFRGAWSARRKFHLSLAATWLLLAWLVAGTAGRGGTAGASAHVAWWDYAMTQCGAIVHYLGLAIWPHRLVFDYGTDLHTGLAEVAIPALALTALLAATAVALRRQPALGFLGAVFFAVLAPSSSVIPVATQTIAEHRMYFPLAPLIAAAVYGLFRLLGKPAMMVCLIWGAGLGWFTAQRNVVYRSELALWQDTVDKRPMSARAHGNLGKALSVAGRDAEAVAELEKSLSIGPELPETHFNLGLIAYEAGKREEARRHYEAAVRLNPRYAEARINLGVLLLEAGDRDEALSQLTEAVNLAPYLAEAHGSLGSALAQMNRLDDAIVQLELAIQLDPGNAGAHYNYGNAMFAKRRLPEAEQQYGIAVQLAPDDVGSHFNLGVVLLQLQRPAEARTQLEAALRLKPDLQPATELLRQLPQKP